MKKFTVWENEKEKLRLLGIDWEVSMTVDISGSETSYGSAAWVIKVSDDDFNLIKLSHPEILEGNVIISNEIGYNYE